MLALLAKERIDTVRYKTKFWDKIKFYKVLNFPFNLVVAGLAANFKNFITSRSWGTSQRSYRKSSVANPDPNPDPSDPYFFGPPGSGSISQRYGSGSFYRQAKIVRKTMISTAL
jgi:hypothetical protein